MRRGEVRVGRARAASLRLRCTLGDTALCCRPTALPSKGLSMQQDPARRRSHGWSHSLAAGCSPRHWGRRGEGVCEAGLSSWQLPTLAVTSPPPPPRPQQDTTLPAPPSRPEFRASALGAASCPRVRAGPFVRPWTETGAHGRLSTASRRALRALTQTGRPRRVRGRRCSSPLQRTGRLV